MPRLLALSLGLLSVTAPAHAQLNVLLIVADDVGIDRIAAYAEHPDPGRTPSIDSLAANGVLFRHCWANPLCSPTRATLLTGRYGYRTGVGTAIGELGGGTALALSELTLPEALPGYASAACGKWHLGHYAAHPNDSGFDRFAGSLRNLDRLRNGADYSLWTKTVDGSSSISSNYATTDTADETIASMQTLAEPWFVLSSFNAAHTPVHAPPAGLHSYNLSGSPGDDVPLFTRAMIEAMDTEIGRVLAAAPNDTLIVFVGDNGTDSLAADPPAIPGRSKGTLYEGGIRVPLIISGPGVAHGECRALVNTTDVFATIAELTGSSAQALDSVSLAPYLADPLAPPLREWVYAELFNNTDTQRAIRGWRYKLVRRWTPGFSQQLFDLQTDPFEQSDLLAGTLTPEQQDAFEGMACRLPPGIQYGYGCEGRVNSTGLPARLTANGSNSVAAGALCLRAARMPPGEWGFFLASDTAGFVPTPSSSAGDLCLGGSVLRFDLQTLPVDAAGAFDLLVAPAQLPTSSGAGIVAGETYWFQTWFRDAQPNTSSNFSNSIRVGFD
ncbi:MAG: sulfatase-like hydrolase/transferase [bacterium]|nr:sulfatase-like hydrolase/transferase [bacterium]